MAASLGFDPTPFTDTVASGAGRVAAALAVAALAYLLFAAALWLLRPADAPERARDASGFVLVAGLAAYVVAGILLDLLGFALLSGGLLGVAALALGAGEIRSLVARRDAHGH